MNSTFNITGYHGTFDEQALKILEEGFQPEFRENHWLGQGSYFYTEKTLAHWFITKNSVTDHKKKGKGKNIVIIKVAIEEEKKRVLNLDHPEGINYFYNKIRENYDNFKALSFSEDEHRNLCTIIDILAEHLGWNVIIKTFEKETKPSYGAVNTSWFDQNVIPLNVKYKETQICIRNENCVKTKEIEYPINKYTYPAKIRFS